LALASRRCRPTPRCEEKIPSGRYRELILNLRFDASDADSDRLRPQRAATAPTGSLFRYS
jgi:hypothetical protein